MTDFRGPETTTSYATNFMLELLLGLQHAYRKGGVLSDQYKRGNLEEHDYDGNTARVTVIRNIKQGTAPVSETGTMPVGYKVDSLKANIGIAELGHVVSLTKRLPKITGNTQTSFEQAATLHMGMAQDALIKTRNELLHGTGDGLLATVSGSTSASSATTQAIKVGNGTTIIPNMALLYVGRVIDVLVNADLTTAHLLCRITSVDETAGAETITVADATDDTANCSFATTTANGVYIMNSNVGSANILQGYRAATAQTGTFQGVSRTTYPDYKSVDGRNGVTSAADLGVSIFDAAVRRRGRNLTPGQTFNRLWVSSQGVLDQFTQTLQTQMRWNGDMGTLDSGFEFVKYKGERLFADYDAPLGRITCIPTDDITLLEIDGGTPAFDKMQGDIWQRFSRAQPVESWLLSEEQAAYQRVDRFVYCANLNEAT